MSSHKKQYFQLSSRAKACIFMASRRAINPCLLFILAIPFLGMIVAGFQSKSPSPVYASSHKEQETGTILFHKAGCEHCHGVDGVGTDKAPSLSDIGTIWKKSQIKRQILDGGHEMPPFRDALKPDEVNALVEYLSTKREVRSKP